MKLLGNSIKRVRFYRHFISWTIQYSFINCNSRQI